MTINQHVDTFAGKTVKDWDVDTGIVDPEMTIYRLAESYGSKKLWSDIFADFIHDPEINRVTGIVVGQWAEEMFNEGPVNVIEAIVSARERLPHLTAIFLGDLTYEESEISWINQTDVSPLLEAFPLLEHFRVRGGTNLSLGTLRHQHLKSLVVETGGLDRNVVSEVMSAQLPELEHLELWVGTDNYGRTCTAEDFAPLFNGNLFPKLRYLGLRDADIANDLAFKLALSPLLARIETLDMSLGTLSEGGVEALLGNPALLKLHRLDIHHHYCTDEITKRLVEKLNAANVSFDVSENNRYSGNDNDDWRYVAVGE